MCADVRGAKTQGGVLQGKSMLPRAPTAAATSAATSAATATTTSAATAAAVWRWRRRRRRGRSMQQLEPAQPKAAAAQPRLLRPQPAEQPLPRRQFNQALLRRLRRRHRPAEARLRRRVASHAAGHRHQHAARAGADGLPRARLGPLSCPKHGCVTNKPYATTYRDTAPERSTGGRVRLKARVQCSWGKQL